MRSILRLSLLLALLLLLLGWEGIRAQGVNRAGLVVQFGDGNVVTACVQFTSERVTGAELLRLSGMDVIMDPNSGFGEAICKISVGDFSDGCDFPLEECFCQCTGADCEYWAYYHLQDNAWEYSQLGASNWLVKDGDVEGWAWGPGSFSGGGSSVEPPVIPFDEICIPFTPTPTFTLTPITPSPTLPVGTATATPTATFTPTPTSSPTPTASPTSTSTPTATPTLAPGVTPSPTPTPRPPVVVDLQLSPTHIIQGECAQLQWTVSYADSAFLSINGHEENVPLVSAREVCPTQDTTYTLRAFRPDAEVQESRTLTVRPAATSPQPTAVTIIPTTTPIPSPTPNLSSPTPAPPPPAASPSIPTATPTPARVASIPTFQPIQRLTPQPEGGRSRASTGLAYWGGFVIMLIILIAAGFWALRRQS